MTAAVALYVESLYGRGHLARAAALARALNAAGLPTTLLTGTPNPPADVAHVAPPTLFAEDERIKTLLTPAGAPPDDAYWAERRAVLADAVAALRPAVLITETYPFGRPRFAAEAATLLDAADAVGAKAVASVRDVLVARANPRVYADAAEIARRRYARVLIHSDPNIVHFRETFPQFDAIADRATHTGYVWSPPAPGGDASGEVVVSAGGGRVAERLLTAASAARALSRRFHSARWRLIAGPDARFDHAAPDGVVIERARDDLPALLQTAAMSISRCGYNTALDVVAGGAPAVFAPFSTDRQTEQRHRALRFAAMGYAHMIEDDELTPANLAAAVDADAAAPRPKTPIDCGGLARSVAAIKALVG